MRSVYVAGVGQTRAGERADVSLRELAREALQAALADAEAPTIGALVVGNMLAGELNSQSNLACLLADHGGCGGVEAVRVEAACGSGGAAMRIGALMVASGAHDCVVVLGVEKMTDRRTRAVASLAGAADADFEALHEATFSVLNGLIMRRYMHEHRCTREDFAGFSINAHRNGARNPNAMFHKPIGLDEFKRSPAVAPPVHVLDASPICDGAAAVVLVPEHHPAARRRPAVRVAGSAGRTDTIAVATRRAVTWLDAAERSAKDAYGQASMGPEDVDVFELHDAFTIMAALSLEAAGFAAPGHGVRMACEERIGLGGKIPVSTMGGLKARGHPVGASGVYQVVEATLQLRGQAAGNQVDGARVAMCQSIGGSGAAVFTHILSAA